MNKYLVISVLIWVIFGFTVFGRIDNSISNHSSEGETEISLNLDKAKGDKTDAETNTQGIKRVFNNLAYKISGGRNMNKSDYSDVRIKMNFKNEEVIVKMYDNSSSRDFVSLLPLTLMFEDYARTEKITYLPRELSTKDAPSGSNPSVGDFTYYSPWGNLAIFYKDFGYASGLIKLGHIESGIDKLANMKGKFEVTIEKID